MKTVDFSEIIEEYIFPGFVCFVLYLAKISGERLQDHWSSGFISTLVPLLLIGSSSFLQVRGTAIKFCRCELWSDSATDCKVSCPLSI